MNTVCAAYGSVMATELQIDTGSGGMGGLF